MFQTTPKQLKMRKQHLRPLFYLPFFFALTLIACTNTATPATSSVPGEPGRAGTMVSNPDAADLLQTLQGRWQNEQDSTWMIEISSDKIKRYDHGKMSLEMEIEIDGTCQSNACKTDSTNLPNGWCFIEKGQYDAQCNMVVKCDKQTLWYQIIGAGNDTLRFGRK